MGFVKRGFPRTEELRGTFKDPASVWTRNGSPDVYGVVVFEMGGLYSLQGMQRNGSVFEKSGFFWMNREELTAIRDAIDELLQASEAPST